MPNTGFLILGAMGLLYLMRGEGTGTRKPGTLAHLLNADMASSGEGSFGGEETNLNPPTLTPVLNTAILRGNQPITALAVDATSGVPAIADTLQPESAQIAGTLNALFDVQGVTVSEISGNAVRQVGLLSPYESTISESNYPQIGFVDISVDGVSGSPFEIDDEPIEVLPPKAGAPLVFTISGNDQSTPVTTGINRSSESYFTTTATLLEAVSQGYFDTPAPYVPRTVLEIEESWKDTAAGEAAPIGVIGFTTGGAGTGYGIDMWGDEG